VTRESGQPTAEVLFNRHGADAHGGGRLLQKTSPHRYMDMLKERQVVGVEEVAEHPRSSSSYSRKVRSRSS
jgi:hypothetical protein